MSMVIETWRRLKATWVANHLRGKFYVRRVGHWCHLMMDGSVKREVEVCRMRSGPMVHKKEAATERESEPPFTIACTLHLGECICALLGQVRHNYLKNHLPTNVSRNWSPLTSLYGVEMAHITRIRHALTAHYEKALQWNAKKHCIVCNAQWCAKKCVNTYCQVYYTHAFWQGVSWMHLPLGSTHAQI